MSHAPSLTPGTRSVESLTPSAAGASCSYACASSSQIIKEVGSQLSGLTFEKGCPLTEEEIREHSQLDSMGATPLPDIHKLCPVGFQGREETLLRVVGNFIGGGLVTGGGSKDEALNLDGFWGHPNFVTWKWVLEDLYRSIPDGSREQKRAVEKLIQAMHQLCEFTHDLDHASDPMRHVDESSEKGTISAVGSAVIGEMAQKYAQKIEQLKIGESEYFYGGWGNQGGGSGHALIYEWTRTRGECFDLHVYTSTGFQLTGTVLKGDKHRLKPVVRFEAIPEDHLLLNGDGMIRPAVFQSLIEQHALARWNSTGVVNEENILQILDYLALYRTHVPLKEYGAVTGQRAGTCVPSSTKQLLRKLCGSAALYKQVMFHVKWRLLHTLYHGLSKEMDKDSKKGALARRSLRLSAQKMLRRTAKLATGVPGAKPLIDRECALEAQATAHDLLLRIDAVEKKLQEKRATLRVLSDLSAAKTEEQRRIRNSLSIDSSRSLFERMFLQMNLPPSEVSLNPGTLLEDLTRLETTIEKVSQQSFQAEIIERIVDQLPIPKTALEVAIRESDYWVSHIQDSFWDAVPKKDIPKIMQRLETLNQKYRILRHEISATRYFATLYPLHSLTHFLAITFDATLGQDRPERARLERYPVPFYGNALKKMEGLVYFDRNEHRRTNEAITYFVHFNHQATQPKLFETEFNSKVIKDSIHKSLGNGVLWRSLLDTDDKLRSLVDEAAEKRFPTLSEPYIKREYEKMEAEYSAWEAAKTKYDRYQLHDIRHREWVRTGKQGPEPIWEGDIPRYHPGREPERPQYLKNLPHETRQMLIMEEGANPKWALPYLWENYQHIHLLRRMTYQMCRATFVERNESLENSFEFAAVREGNFSSVGYLYRGGVHYRRVLTASRKKLPLRDHRVLRNAPWEDSFRDSYVTTRKKEEWERSYAEGKTLREKDAFHSLLGRFERTLSEWKLTPYQLIYEFSREFEELLNPTLQEYFNLLFFRSPVTESGKMHLGVGQLILEDQALVENCLAFINKGLAYYRKHTKNIEGGRFFFELAFYLLKYCREATFEDVVSDETPAAADLSSYACSSSHAAAQASSLAGSSSASAIEKVERRKEWVSKELTEQFCQLQKINRWLLKGICDEEGRAILHLYRILFYSLQKSPDPSEVYTSWITYHFQMEDGEKRSPAAFACAKQFILNFTSRMQGVLQDNPEERGRICSKIIQKLGLDLSDEKMDWIEKVPGTALYTVSRPGGCSWTISFLNGSVYNESGKIMGVDSNHQWEKREDFCRIFHGKTGFSYTSSGSSFVTFTHPTMGPIRIVKDYYRYSIQRKFPGHPGWFQYVPSRDLTSGYPKILKEDHAFWIPIDQESAVSYITTLKEDTIRFGVNPEGIIFETDSSGHLKEGARTVDFLHASESVYASAASCSSSHSDEPDVLEGITRFEQGKDVLTFRDESETLQELHFPRYVSEAKNRLIFIREKGNLVLDANRQYALPRQMPTAYLGTVQQYLYLQSLKEPGQGKLIVPFQKILSEQSPIASGKLDIRNQKSLLPIPSEREPVESWGLQTYFIYDVNEGEMLPTSQSGKLFLAYVHMSQKKYSEAMELLRSLKATEELTEESLKILELIQDYALGEDHPDGKYVKLYALYLQMREQERVATAPIGTFFPQDTCGTKLYILARMQEGLQALNNVSSGCRLRPEEEKFLLDRMLKEKIKISIPVIKKHLKEKIIPQLRRRLLHLENPQDEAIEALELEVPSERDPVAQKHARMPQVSFNLPDKPNEPTFCDRDSERFKARQTLSYERKLVDYHRRLEKDVDWLSKGRLSSIYTRPDRSVWIAKNGKLFLEVCRLAKERNPDAITEMVIRLHQWRGVRTATSDVKLLDLMIKILELPNSFARVVSHVEKVPTMSHEEKGEFLKAIETVYCNVTPSEWRNHPGNYLERHARNRIAQASSSMAAASAGSSRETGMYPIPKASAFDSSEKTADQIAAKEIPLRIALPFDGERWRQLQAWKGVFLEPEAHALAGPSETPVFKLEFDPILLSNREKGYEKSLRRDLQTLQEDYLAGKKIQEDEESFTLPSAACPKFASQVEETLQRIRRERQERERSLLQEVNQTADDPLEREAERARIGGGVQKPLTFQDCVACVLALDVREYQRRNPHLKDPNLIQAIAEETLAVEGLKSYEAQLMRIATLLKKIEAIEEESSYEKRALCRELTKQLEASYQFEAFTPEVQVALHVFAGETEMIPYAKQAAFLKKMLKVKADDPTRYRDLVIQLIMGGGKTSVLATILLYLAAREEGRMALFIVPGSLFSVVKENFSEAMLQAFHKETQAVDLNRKDLTPYKLKQLLADLKRAQEGCEPIVVKATTLQCFELELLSQARHFKANQEALERIEEKLVRAKERKQNIEKELRSIRRRRRSARSIRLESENKQIAVIITQIEEQIAKLHQDMKEEIEPLKLLAQVVKEIAAHSDALLDEVDLILDCLQEVNFPAGKTKAIKPVRNQLLLAIFKTLIRTDLKIDTLEGSPSIAELVKLQEKQQELFSPDLFLEHVIPVIAKELGENFEPIQQQLGKFSLHFVRYVTGKFPPFLQTFIDDSTLPFYPELLEENHPGYEERWGSFETLEKDLAFLRYLQQLNRSKDSTQSEASHLIALTRHFLLELLPVTLQKSGQKDFGPAPDDPVKQIPYLGVHTPATTEFGYHWEEACYYYQWAASFSIQEKQVLDFANMATQAAHYYMQKNGEAFEKTAEYEEFHRLFGVKLDALEADPSLIHKVLEEITKYPEKVLELQAEVVAAHVTYRTERLTSNGMALIDQLGTRRSMSGIPWNVEGYPISLASRYRPDLGTEGRILHTLAERSESQVVSDVDYSSVRNFLHKVFADAVDPKEIRGIIECGALFKAFPKNDWVAKEIMEFLTEMQEKGRADEKIEGVLFFHNDPGQLQPDTLYVWRKGATKPERIGGTSVEALRAKGLDPSNYFVYYDERHTTGVDLKQETDAINIVTFSPGLPWRDIPQALLRMRKYLETQDALIAIGHSARPKTFQGGASVEALVLNATAVQSIRKTTGLVRYFREQNHNIFRSQAVQGILAAVDTLTVESSPQFAEKVTILEEFFVTNMDDAPFMQHGRLKQKHKTKELLGRRLHSEYQRFRDRVPNGEAGARATKAVDEMQEYIATADGLPEEVIEHDRLIGIEQEIEVQAQVQTEVHVELELELELEVELELQRYEQVQAGEIRKDQGVSEKQLFEMIEMVKGKHPGGDLIALQEQLTRFDYGLLEEKAHYDQVFSQPIFGTKTFFYTCKGEQVLPVFHKMQRPPNQILAVRVMGEIRWLMVSEHEAAAIRKHLKRLYQRRDPRVENVWLIQPDGSLLANGKYPADFPLQDELTQLGLIEINVFAGKVDYLEQTQGETEEWLEEPEEHRELKIRFLKLRTARNEKLHQIFCQLPLFHKGEEEEVQEGSFHLFAARIEREKHQQGTLSPSDAVATKVLDPQDVKKLNVGFVKHLGIDWALQETDPITQAAIAQIKEQFRSNHPGLDEASIVSGVKDYIEKLVSRQFRHLSLFQGSYLLPEQIQWLPPKKVHLLARSDQIYRAPLEEGVLPSYFLKEEHIPHLKSKQKHLIPFLNPELFRLLDKPWQIALVPPEHVDKINPEMAVHLTEEQIKAIPFSRAAEFFACLPLPEQFSYVHGDLIPLIPPQYLSHVKRKQIYEITKPDVIAHLEHIASHSTGRTVVEGTWTSWILPKMVKHLNFPIQAQFLTTKAQLTRVPLEQLVYLIPFQVPHLTNQQLLQLHEKLPEEVWLTFQKQLTQSQVQSFDTKELVALLNTEQIHNWLEPKQILLLQEKWQIQACSPKVIVHFSHEQISLMAKPQVPHLRGEEQIHALTQELFDALVTEDERETERVNQMQWISDAQLVWVTPEQVKGIFSHEQLMQLNQLHPEAEWEPFQQALTPSQINTFRSKETLSLLSAEQIKQYLTEEQVPYLLDPWLVEACPEKFVKHLDPKLQVPHIVPSQVSSLVGKEQVEACPCQEKHIHRITESQLKHLTEAQATLLTPKQIALMDTREEIEKLTQKQWQYLSQRGVQALSDAEIVLLQQDEQLHHLIPWLLSKKLPLIKDKKAAKCVTTPQFDTMCEMTVNQLGKKSPLWKRLTPKAVGLVTHKNVKRLFNRQLPHLLKKKAIQRLSFWKVKFLTRNQLRKRSKGQFFAYMLGVITLGILSSVIAGLAHMTLAPLITWLASRSKGKRFMAKLHGNPIRLGLFFKTYFQKKRRVA